MEPHALRQEDLDLAYATLARLLRRGCPVADLRRRAERILMKSEPDSYRYAFWRLILERIVADSIAGSRGRRNWALAS
jgi:hypothetical protein